MSDAGSDNSDRIQSDEEHKEEYDEYDEEMERNRRFAKYWCGEEKEVIIGVERRATPIALDSLCGTYRWTYEIPEKCYGWPEEISVSRRGDKEPGFLTLSIPKGKKPTLQHLSGKLDHFGKKGQFTGLIQAKDSEKNVLMNFWDIKKLDWDEDYGDNQQKGNCLLVLKVCDDEGNPFIKFKYIGPGGKFGDEFLDIVAKKQKDADTNKGLTDAERKRLGMDLYDAEVKLLAVGTEEKVQEQKDEDKEEDSEEAGEAEDNAVVAAKARGTSIKRKAEDESEGAAPQKRKTINKKA